MTKYCSLLFFLIACNSQNKKLIYQDSSNKFYVTIKESKKDRFKDSLFTFYDFNNPSKIKEVGFLKDGFRNDLWNYNLPSSVKTIKWAHYRDKCLNFETNLFAEADSAKYGDSYTKLLFSTDEGQIVLSI